MSSQTPNDGKKGPEPPDADHDGVPPADPSEDGIPGGPPGRAEAAAVPKQRKARRAVFSKRKGKARGSAEPTGVALPAEDAPVALEAGPPGLSEPDPDGPEPLSPPIPPEPMTPEIPPEPMTPEIPPEPITPPIPAEPLTPPMPAEPLTPPMPTEPTSSWSWGLSSWRPPGREAPPVGDEPAYPDDAANDRAPEEAGPEDTVPEEFVPDEAAGDEYVPEETIHEEALTDVPLPDADETIPDDRILEAGAADGGAVAVPPPRMRRGRRWPWYVLGAAAVIGAVVVAATLYAPRFAEQQALAQLHDMGFPAAQLSVDSLGVSEAVFGNAGQAVVRDVKLGPELSAQQMVATYTLSGIRQGRVDSVVVRGLRGKVTADETGPLFGSLDKPIQAMLASSGGPPMALPAIRLEDAVVDVATPLGPATLHLAGDVRPEPDALATLGFDLQADVPLGRLAGRLEATADKDGRIAGSFIVKDGNLAVADQGSTKLAGFVQFALSDSGIERIDSNLALTEPSVAGTSFSKGTLVLAFSKEAARLNLLLASTDGAFDVQATGLVQDPYGAGALSASVEVAAAPGAPVWAWAGLPPPAAGKLRAKGTLSAALPNGAIMHLAALMDTLPTQKDLTGSLNVDLEDMSWPGIGQNIGASGAVDLSHGEGGIVASVPAEILGEFTPAPELLDALGLQGKPREEFANHLSLSLGFAQQLFVLSNPDTVTISGRPLLSLTAPNGHELNADVWGTIVAGRDGKLRSFRIDAGKLSALGIELDQVTLASLTVEVGLAGTPEAFDGSLRVAATSPDLAIPGLHLANMDLLLEGAVARTAGLLTVRLTGEKSRAIASIVKPRSISQAKPLRLGLRPGRNPFLAMDWGPPGDAGDAEPHVAFDLATAPFTFDIPAASSAPITTRFARLALTGTFSPSRGIALKVVTDGSRIAMPKQNLEATGVSVQADVPQTGPIRASYRIGALTQGGKSPYLVPVAVSGSTVVTDDRVTFDVRATAAGEGLVATAKGQHDTVHDNGSADVDIQPIAFATNGLQPWQLFPPIGRSAVQADGTVAVTGRAAWGQTESSTLQIALKDLTLTTPQVTLHHVNGTVKFDNLDPLSTPPGQTIAIGQADLGLPLTDGQLTFQILPENKLKIDRARLTLAGGEVSAEPVTIDWTSGTQQVAMLVKGVDLDSMLKLADVDGLSAAGRLEGRIPIFLEGGTVLVRGAELVAPDPGVLRYAPEQTPGSMATGGESMQLVLQALRNFQYSKLRLSFDRDAAREMHMKIKLDGKNPDFYDGYPFNFNLNINGKLDEILE